MKKVLRRLLIVAALSFLAFSLFSCTTEELTDTSVLDYKREMLSDVWTYTRNANERIEKTINIDGTFQEHYISDYSFAGFRTLIKDGNWSIDSNDVMYQDWFHTSGGSFSSEFTYVVTIDTLTVGDLVWQRKR